MRDGVVGYFPYIRAAQSGNKYINYMIDAIREKYVVKRLEEIHFDEQSVRTTKAIMLNWAESYLDDTLKNRIQLYKNMGIPIIWFYHNNFPHNETLDAYQDKMQWLIDICDVIVCHSFLSISTLNKWGAEYKGRYVPIPAYLGKYNRFDSLYEDNSEGKGITFGQFGSINPYKQYHVMIKAFLQSARAVDRLVIAGSVSSANFEYAEMIKELSRGHDNIVIDFEHSSDEDLFNYHKKCDIICVPYETGSCLNSSALIMALSYSKPVIVSDFLGAQDINVIGRGKYDTSFVHMYNSESRNDVNELSRVIDEVIVLGRNNLKKEGEEAFRYVSDNNSISSVKRSLFEIIDGFDMLRHNNLNCADSNIISQIPITQYYHEIDSLRVKLSKSGLINQTMSALAQRILNGDNIFPKNITNIAIYGYGLLGKFLFDYAVKESKKVDYIIDRAKGELLSKDNTPILSIEDDLPYTQLIIITALYDSEEIELKLKSRVTYDVVALDDLLEGIPRI